MATLTVQNLTSSPVYIRDLYATIAPNGSISTIRFESDLSRMGGLQAAIAAGQVAASIQLSSTEQSSGLLAQGIAQGPATGVSPEEVVRVSLVAGVGATPDDVLVYAADHLPAAKMRIMEAYAVISTAGGVGSTLQVRTAVSGGGTLCAEISAHTAGHADQDNTVTATQVITNGSTVGLWVHRTDNTTAGEVFITLRPEI